MSRWNTDTFTHRRFYTEALLRTHALHTDFFYSKGFYTQTPFKKEIHQNSRKCRFMCLF